MEVFLTNLLGWPLPGCCRLLHHEWVLVAPFRTAGDDPTKKDCADEDAENEDVHENSPVQVHLRVLEWERERGGGWSRLSCDEYSIHG